MRKLILTATGILLIIISVFGAKAIIANKKKKKPTVEKVTQSVYVETVENKSIPIVISSTGSVKAKRRIELYSEVQGIFKRGQYAFKTGQAYNKGARLVTIDSSEYYASVQSSKSEFYNLLTSIMPDLRLDYPEVFNKWNDYLSRLNMNKSLPQLPNVTSDKEKYFITGKGIYSSYYNIKNLEQRLSKYVIYAPFSGILINASVTEGTLIRSGQKLGEFIKTGTYEIEVAIGKEYSELLKIGGKVQLSSLENDKKYTGKIVRVNGSIDQSTQTILTTIEVKNSDLKEGMYLNANIEAKEVANAIRIQRNLLQENNTIFVVKDSILDLAPVTPIHFSDKTVVIQGLKNGELMVAKNISDAYTGMRVKIQNQDTAVIE